MATPDPTLAAIRAVYLHHLTGDRLRRDLADLAIALGAPPAEIGAWRNDAIFAAIDAAKAELRPER